MRRIPCAFVVGPDGLATNEPAVDWFAEGLGVATRKWDGLPHLIARNREGEVVLYRGVRYPRVAAAMPPAIETSDADDPEVSGWVPARWADAPDLYRGTIERLAGGGKPIEPGTYELCGPGIKGNPEGLEQPTLIHHRLVSYLSCPREREPLTWFLAQHRIEGVVWHHDGQACRLTRRDVGLAWPPGSPS